MSLKLQPHKIQHAVWLWLQNKDKGLLRRRITFYNTMLGSQQVEVLPECTWSTEMMVFRHFQISTFEFVCCRSNTWIHAIREKRSPHHSSLLSVRILEGFALTRINKAADKFDLSEDVEINKIQDSTIDSNNIFQTSEASYFFIHTVFQVLRWRSQSLRQAGILNNWVHPLLFQRLPNSQICNLTFALGLPHICGFTDRFSVNLQTASSPANP